MNRNKEIIKVVKVVCILAALILFVIPFPKETEKEGTTILCTLVPIVEIHFWEYDSTLELVPGVDGEPIHKSGYQVFLCGASVRYYEKYTPIESPEATT